MDAIPRGVGEDGLSAEREEGEMVPGAHSPPGNVERAVTCIYQRHHASRYGTRVIVGLSPSGELSETSRTLRLSGATREEEALAQREAAAQAQRRLWPTGEREVFILRED